MVKERSLVFIKPEHVDKAEEIFEFLDRLLDEGFEKLAGPLHIPELPKELVEEHYAHRQDSPCYPATLQSFLDKGVVLSVYVGEDIINRIRNVLGNVDPSKAEKGTIRAKYGIGSVEDSVKRKDTVKNVMHASGNGKEAKEEIELWKKYLGEKYKVLDLTKPEQGKVLDLTK